MLRLTTFCLLLGFALAVDAQMRKTRGDVFPLDYELKNNGFFVAPGFTYLLNGQKGSASQQIVDTTISYEGSPNGSIGAHLQVGWYKAFENPQLIHFVEAAITYKQFRGNEDYVFNQTVNGSTVSTNATNSFNDHVPGLSLRATNVSQFATNAFVTNAIGVNGDFPLIKSRTTNGSSSLANTQFPGEPYAQIHYQLGFGYRISRYILLIPSLETPILTVHNFDEGKSTLNYFHSRHRPIIFSLRFMFLRRDPVKCNAPVFDGPVPNMQ